MEDFNEDAYLQHIEDVHFDEIACNEEIDRLRIKNKRLQVKIKKIIDALNYLDTDEKRIRTIKVILHKELKNKLTDSTKRILK